MINNVKKGIIIIVLSTLFFAIIDGVSRYLADTYNVFVKFHDSVKNLAFKSLKPT